MAAATYFIAGRSNCPFFAKAQRIGEIIQKNLPSVAVRIESKHPTEWPDYLGGLCERLNFKHGGSPIIYTQLGTLVGGSDAFLALVRKLYGNFVEFPTAILNELAMENLEISEQAKTKKEHREKKKQHELQWELRNKRLDIVGTQVVNVLNSCMSKEADLYRFCQSIKAMLEVASNRYKLPGDSVLLQDYLAALPDVQAKIEEHKKDNAELFTQANSFESIPSILPSASLQFSANPDHIWKQQFLEHYRVMTELTSILARLHESQQKLRTEVAEFVKRVPATSLTKTPSKLPKSVSFAAVDTLYSPKKHDPFYSVPNTPKGAQLVKEPEISVDASPVDNAIKEVLLGVEEGVALLKKARKQLRADMNNAVKAARDLRQVLSTDSFRHFRLRERKELTKNVHLFRFDLPSPTDYLGCPIGQHVFIKIPEMERPYSPITTDSDLGYFDIVVKVSRETPMMDYFTSLNPGDWIPIRGPGGPLVLQKEEAFSGVSMFAHGVGITPMLQMIRHFLSRDESLPIWLLYFNNSEDQILLKEELERLSATHSRLNLRYISTKPGHHWEDLRKHDLAPSLPFRPAGFDLANDPKPIKIFICGPKTFTKKTKALLEELGQKGDEVHVF